MSEATSPDINAEQMSKKYKLQTYGFFAFSWLLGFVLIFIIPKDIMTHTWAQQFVSWVGSVVPMVEGLEQIRLHGSSDTNKSHLIVMSHVSFYYAFLWVIALLSTPYVMYLVKGNFMFNADCNFAGLMMMKTTIHRIQNHSKLHYLGIVLIPLATLFIYTNTGTGGRWFRFRYINEFTAGSFGSIFTIGVPAVLIILFYIHFLVKQSERGNVKSRQ